MRTSGLVLDIYDDFQGQTLRSLYPTFDQIPEQVKTAAPLSAEIRAALPDDVFALVLQNEGETIRKYACIDEGNTILSVEFFLKNAHKLPVEAQTVAAENLKVACAWYNVTPPLALEKIALGAGAVLAGVAALPLAANAFGEAGQRQDAVRALGGADGTIVTPHQRDAFRANMMKSAEVSGTVLAPNKGPTSQSPGPEQSVVRKSAGVGHLVAGRHDKPTELPGATDMTKKKAPESLPQMRVLRPHVDVSNKLPPKVIQEKKASRYALPEEEKYPLDSYVQVKTASEYFDTYGNAFQHEDRHEYCKNLVKRAEELSIPVSFRVRKYGSVSFAPDEEQKLAQSARRELLGENGDAVALLDEIYEKRASLSPDAFCAVLSEFDKVAHLDVSYDSSLSDPWYSTYGVKEAEPWSYVQGNDMVTEAQLRRLARMDGRMLKNSFDDDFVKEFRKDPIGIFESLPMDQKKRVMRQASDNTSPSIDMTP